MGVSSNLTINRRTFVGVMSEWFKEAVLSLNMQTAGSRLMGSNPIDFIFVRTD